MLPGLTDEQRYLRDATRRLLRDGERAPSPDDQADRLLDSARRIGCDIGWTAMFVPESCGGGSVSGRPVAEAAIIAEEFGRSLLAGSPVSTNVVAEIIARAGSAEQQERWLAPIATGEVTASVAYAEPGIGWQVEATGMVAEQVTGGYRLTGTKVAVADAASAKLLLVSARLGSAVRQFLVPLPNPRLVVESSVGLDLAREFGSAHFDDVVVSTTDRLPDASAAGLRRGVELAAVLHCAETIGALDRCFDMSLAYAKQRRAFGRAIGSFQALKHRLADMLMWLESAKAAVYAAVDQLDESSSQSAEGAELAASVAKAYVSEFGPAIARASIQIHGGVGFTWEYELHRYVRRIEANALLYGDREHHLDAVATRLGLVPAHALVSAS